MRRLALLLALAAGGCGKVVGDRVGDAADGGVFDARVGPDAPLSAPDTVRELRQAMPRPGDTVMLRGAVVTGRAVQRGVGIVYVQDAGGGMGTGIRLVCGLDATCPTTRAQIEGLALGQVIDVSGTFDLTAAPIEPQIVRFSMTPKGGTMTPVATVVDPAVVAHDQAAATGTAPWLGTYVRVSGPLTVNDLTPTQLRESCDAIDAGPTPAYRGVFIRHDASGKDLAVQTIELAYCVSQCGVTCPDEIMVGDKLSSATGVLIVGERSGGTPELIIRPSRDADLPKQ